MASISGKVEGLARRAAAAALALLTLWAAAAAEPPATPLRLLTANFPPYTIESGHDAPGPLVNLTLELIARSGHAGKVEFVPWPRAQAITAREANALIIPLVRSSERETKYQWIGKLYCRSMGFVALRERLHRFDEQALASARLVVLRATPYGANLKAASIAEATSFEDMAKMLSLDMVDAIYANQETSLLALQARGIERAALALSAPVESDLLWLAGSPGMPRARVEELQQALRALQKDGTMERLLEQSGLPRAACTGN